MHALSANSMSIVYNKKCFSAAKCRKCGAKMYPQIPARAAPQPASAQAALVYN
jgi:hypothetical protein